MKRHSLTRQYKVNSQPNECKANERHNTTQPNKQKKDQGDAPKQQKGNQETKMAARSNKNLLVSFNEIPCGRY